ncbi:hypothetical protein QOT17_000154 [Balamuthia mandrillaris]
MADWSLLPQELLASVFCFVDLSSLYHCFTVSKKWHAAAMSDLLWKDRALRLSSSTTEEEKDGETARTWYERYKEAAQVKFCFHPVVADKAFLLWNKRLTAERNGAEGQCPKLFLSSQRQCEQQGKTSSMMRGEYAGRDAGSTEERVRAELQENGAMFTQWQNKRVRLEFEVFQNWELGFFHDPKSFRRFVDTFYLDYGVRSLPLEFQSAMFSMFSGRVTWSTIKPDMLSEYTPPPTSPAELEEYFTNTPCDYKSLSQSRKEFERLLEVKRADLKWQKSYHGYSTLVVEVDGRARQVKFTIDGVESEPVPTPFDPFVLAFSTGNGGGSITLVKQSVTCA